MRKRLLKENNDGLSLVEVLVGVAILAVVLVPLMAGFANVSTSTRKLKTIQKGTTLAQNVMEKTKNSTMDSVKKTFNTNAGLNGYTVDSSYEANPSNPASKVSSSDASCYVDDDGKYQYRNRRDGKYSFVYKGVKDGSDKYDVVVSMDSDKYYGDTSGTGYNKTSLGSVAGLDSKRTAVISTTNDITSQAVEYFVAHDYGDATSVSNNLTVWMNIDFSGDDSTDDGTMLVTASPTYIYHTRDEDYTWSPGLVFQKSFKVTTSEHLERIYVLMNQSSSSRKNGADEINLNVLDESNLGNTDTPPAIYIVKQASSGVVDVNKNLDILASDSSYFESLFSDIRGNLPINYLNQSQYALMVRGSDGSTNNKLTPQYLTYKFVESDNILQQDATTPDADDRSDNRAYGLTVKVYKADTDFSEVVTTLTSTRRE